MAPSGQLYMLNAGHQVTEYNGSGIYWTAILDGAQAIAMAPDGTLYALPGSAPSGTWWTPLQYNASANAWGQPTNPNTVVSTDGTLFQVNGNQVQQCTTSGWVTVPGSSGAQALGMTSNHTIYMLTGPTGQLQGWSYASNGPLTGVYWTVAGWPFWNGSNPVLP
jgi:hypothetical protein